jgi:hypothetical protein
VLAWAGTAGALDPGLNCRVGKNKEAGKYAACRQKAEAKALTTGEPADYTKCNERFLAKMTKLEGQGGGWCPDSIADPNTLADFITEHCDAVATALAGGGRLVCGDNLINTAGEMCDGSNLGGETCASFGFSGGTLACSSCRFDLSGCSECTPSGGSFPATGQTTAFGPGSDGAVQAGATLSYTDNEDGTVTDNNTGLMWEKKDQAWGIHDVDNKYTWGISAPPYTMNGTMVTEFLAALNTPPCFAEHCDWRIPNVKELQSIVDYDVPCYWPTVNAAFNTGCASSCTVDGVGGPVCSCTSSDGYWSSTTGAIQPFGEMVPFVAWYVFFGSGSVNIDPKDSHFYVRAVRGGL